MRAVNNQWFPLFLCTIFLLGAQLSLALNPSTSFHLQSDVSASTEISPLQNGRVLDTVTTVCNSLTCTVSDSLQDLEYVTYFGSLSTITIKIQVGKSKATLQMALSSTTTVPMTTTFELSPSDSSQDVSVSHLDGANWQSSLSFGSSAYSSRQLIVRIMNNSPDHITTSTFTLDAGSKGISTITIIESAVGGIIGVAIVLLIILTCIRRRRLRILMRRRRAQASYQAQNIQQFPPQQPVQPGLPELQAQLQGSIIYQPINPNLPNYQMYQPGNIQYLPAANYPQPDYQGQGHFVQLAPMVMPANPEEGPLSETNFNYRFPEAPFQNFASSFPQKICSICLDDLKIDENCRQLYCEHIFHGECAKSWLLNQMAKQNHGYCPNCNLNMTFVMK